MISTAECQFCKFKSYLSGPRVFSVHWRPVTVIIQWITFSSFGKHTPVPLFIVTEDTSCHHIVYLFSQHSSKSGLLLLQWNIIDFLIWINEVRVISVLQCVSSSEKGTELLHHSMGKQFYFKSEMSLCNNTFWGKHETEIERWINRGRCYHQAWHWQLSWSKALEDYNNGYVRFCCMVLSVKTQESQ